MSHGAPASNGGNFFSYGDLDFSDMTGGQMGGDGQDTNDMMALLDSNMLGAYGDMSMSMDTTEDHGLPQGFRQMNNGANNGNAISRAENDFNVAANNVPGAGPLPPGSFGQMTMGSAGNTLTEFTKRRNWPAKVVEELKDFLQILDADGRIKYVSPSVLSVTGYSPEDLQDVFLRDLIHVDDRGVFVAELNEAIASGNPLRMFYRFRRKDGEYAIFETIGHAHIAAAKFAPNPNNQSPFCQAVFMMARPYPTTNSSLLDSFLEHKIENERLKRRIAELSREEEADAHEASVSWAQSQEGMSDVGPSTDAGASSSTPFHQQSNSHGGMSPSERNALNIALTKENLEGVASGKRQDSLRDKMARYEGNTHAETIEMLTGLRYIEGERSRGITTGNASPTLIKGDAGIEIPVDRDPRTGEKKKKLKTSDEYVCTDCGTLDSPEWRKGPSGPKTLCNACGLRWAKKEKKRNASTHPNATPDQSSVA